MCLQKEAGVQGVSRTFVLCGCQLSWGLSPRGTWGTRAASLAAGTLRGAWKTAGLCRVPCRRRQHLGNNRRSRQSRCCPFLPQCRRQSPRPRPRGDLSQSFLSTSGHAWTSRSAAALGPKPFLAPETRCAAAVARVHAMRWPRATLRTNFSEKAEPPEEPPVPHA